MFFPTPPVSHRMKSISRLILIGILSSSLTPISSSCAATKAESPPLPALTYADVADLVTAAPFVAKARVMKLQKVVQPPVQPSVEPRKYLLVTAQVESLIRGEGGISPLITFLTSDLGRKDFPKKKQEVLLFARAGTKAGEIQLISRHAMQLWTPDLDAKARAIASEFLRNDSPPSITGIGDAFHIASTIAGEGETQIFLKTANGDPVSLSIVRRPGQQPHWGVSLGEIVDETAVPPARDSLLWYRLACALPPRLPTESTRTLPVLDAEAAQRDYALVIESLGRCGRTL